MIQFLTLCITLLLACQATARDQAQIYDENIKKILDLDEPSVVINHDFSGFSRDPLDAGNSKNLWIMRLLYETPIKYDKNGFMVSDILERFSYDHVKKEISFILKKNITYSDGSFMTIQDIALAIKRMLYSRPDYPSISKIIGITEWLKRSRPLKSMPSGMTIKHDVLTVRFSEMVREPFQWFALELFSVIPTKCINLNTNQISCPTPPFSGQYELIESVDHLLTFGRRSLDKQLPEKLRLIYIPPVRIIKFMEHYKNNHVIIAEEIAIPPYHVKIIKNRCRENSIPEIRLMALSMNKHVPPFNNKRVRQFFASEYRKTLVNLFGHADGSIFTRIMSGYIPLESLSAKVQPFSLKEENEILAILRKHPPIWVKRPLAGEHDPFWFYLVETLKKLKVPVPEAPLEFSRPEDEILSWENGNHNLTRVYTGLGGGGVDSTNDLRMFFSKKMYHFLADLYNDNTLQSYLANIKHTSLHEIDVPNLKNLNTYLYEESVFAVVANYTIAQYTLKNSPLNIINDWTPDISHYFIK